MTEHGGSDERDQMERDKAGQAWTLGSLRLHLLSVIDERDRRYASQQEAGKEAITAALAAAEKAVNAALAAAEKAVSKSEGSYDKRFEGVNEFRQTLSDQQRLFIPRTEVEVLLKGINDRISSEIKGINERSTAELNGIRERLGKAEASRIERAGQQTGKTAGWAMAVGIFAFVMTIVSAVLILARLKP